MQGEANTSDSPQSEHYLLGVDVGSTTAKVVLLDSGKRVVASAYQRHEARILETARRLVEELATRVGRGALVDVALTGTAGMGLGERAKLPFVQEVHAACNFTASFHPEARALLDIGGEDSKLVFFEPDGRIDARMNGSCAGGTGAFLDQMAVLLAIEPTALSALAAKGKRVIPVASRCGVFAKTDVQNLLSRGIAKSDVALSILHALALQVLTTLGRGRTAERPVLVTGGPLTFMPTLRAVFAEKLKLADGELLLPQNGELASALGAALHAKEHGCHLSLGELLDRLVESGEQRESRNTEPPFFDTDEEREAWLARRFTPVERIAPGEVEGELYLGIDSGSTTTKLVLLSRDGKLLLSDYEMNRGDPLGAAQRGMKRFKESLAEVGLSPNIGAAAVTGYGEELLRAAFGIEHGVVETVAHLRAAMWLAPEVSFVLDIGGQDMKALFVRDGRVERVEVNEACSSGCGSFIQTFAEALSMALPTFASRALTAKAPRMLGSRCTVFMNSMVKQALKEGAALEDIAAGLAFSVARNCLQKVLKLRDNSLLGDTVVVQGGTFLNPAVHRAFEKLIKRPVICSEISGLAGAFGAALWAREIAEKEQRPPRPFADYCKVPPSTRKEVHCRGCENACPVTVVTFEGAGRHVSGNRCERLFRNGQEARERGANHMAAEYSLLLERPAVEVVAQNRSLRIGLPMALSLYENLPFWSALFRALGHEVVLSGNATTPAMLEESAAFISSDSICLPGKVANAHVAHLAQRGVDTIFFPQVHQERPSDESLKDFNCPIVAGYPEAVASAVDPTARYGVPYIAPVTTFRDRESLRDTVKRALEAAAIPMKGYGRAFDLAFAAQEEFLAKREELGKRALAESKEQGRELVLLGCRPYHLDPFIHHGVPEMLSDLGYDVLSAQCVPNDDPLTDVKILPQWSYPSRDLRAAKLAASGERLRYVQLNSFACGPDALIADEAASILESHAKPFTLLRVDESTAAGSLRLRLRTMALGDATLIRAPFDRVTTPPYCLADRRRTIIAPEMDPLLRRGIEVEFGRVGYKLHVLPTPTEEALEWGLTHVNNELCYPAIITIGDILRALASGQFPLDEVAIGLTQTGGPCRASNYLPLLKKALVTAGFGDVPVVGIQLGTGKLNEQPGFEIDMLSLFKSGLHSLIVIDALGMMMRALAPRERVPGTARALVDVLIEEWFSDERRGSARTLAFVEHAAKRMGAIEVVRHDVPKVGIVGEIYVKHSPFANHYIVDWLVAAGYEPVVPPLASFFLQEPLNTEMNRKAGLDRRRLAPLISSFVDRWIGRLLTKVNEKLSLFPYHVSFTPPRALAKQAAQVISTAHQYGEGWVLAGEILEMASHGVDRIVCLQPFGCIANHVIAKGVERRLRAAAPKLDLLFLDLDHNTSEANLFNRLELLVHGWKRQEPQAMGSAKSGQ